MKHITVSAWLVYAFLVLLCISCGEESQVGYGLVDDGELDIIFRDDLQISTQTVQFDSIPGSSNSNYFLGGLTDPVFGNIRSEVYMNFGTPITTDFDNAVYHSAFLVLAVDSSVFLGDPDAVHNIQVFELLEVLPDTVYTDETFMSGEEIGRIENFKLSELDTARIPETDTSTTGIPNAIVIPLTREIGGRFFGNEEANVDVESLRDAFAGIHIVSDSDEGLFSLSNNSSKIIFFNDADNVFRSVQYFFLSNSLTGLDYHQTSSIQRDFSGSEIENVLNKPTPRDASIYVQGLAGPVVEINLSQINSLNNVIINHATIEFPVANIIGRDTAFYPSAQFLTLSTRANGEYQNILDVNGATFGGTLTFDEDRGISLYEMNITSHCTEILNGNESEVLYLRLRDGLENPSSAILNGPKHPEFPVKLKITYTEL